MSPMTPQEFGRCLVAAGVLTQEELNRTTRVVIDCTMDSPVEIYVQRTGERHALIKLAPMLGEMLRRGEDTTGLKPDATGTLGSKTGAA